jgi:hypothetical protein
LKSINKRLLLVLFFLLFFLGVIILLSQIHPYILINKPYCPIFCKNPDFENNTIEPNKFFNNRYVEEIKPQGKKIIDSELEKLKTINSTDSKLDEIFKWEIQDWHNPNWERGSFNLFNGSINYYSYKNNVSKIRADPDFVYSIVRQQTPEGIFYGDDPFWIAYNKVGACRELSSLFSYMAQKSGIESRIVGTAWDHQWAEIKIDGEWRYYDPWCAVEHGYYNSTDGNLTFKHKWFNKIENFRDSCHAAAYINWYNEDPIITWYNVFPNINLINENPVINFYFKNPMVYWYFYNPILHYRASLIYTYSYFWHDYKNIVDYFLYRI